MLVLTRKRSERIVIDGQIEVTVLEIRGDRVRLGFQAPQEVSIHREEVYRRLAPPPQEEVPAVNVARPQQIMECA